MKKLFISISAAFVILLSCLIPFNALAIEEDSHYYTYSEFKNYYYSNNDTYDIMFKYQYYDDFWHYNYYHTAGISIPTNNINDVIEQCTMSNGVFTVIFTVATDFHVSSKCDEPIYNSPNDSYHVYKIKKLEYDTNNNSISMYNGNNTLITQECVNNGDCDFDITDFYCNLDEFITNPIVVSVFPDLDEEFNYTGTYEGYTAELNTLQVDIQNNTGNNYEYAILIQPKNEEMNVGLPNSDNNTFFWGSSNVTYALVKDEWIQRDAHDVLSAASNSIGWLGFDFNVHDVSAPITVYCPSAWHYLPHHELKREWIYYEQMQLKKGVDYTFKVYVYNITQNAPLTYSDDLVYPAFNNLELVYTKDFSVARDTVYDADSNSNGAYSFDNTSSLGSQFDKMKGFQEPNGNIKIFDNNDIKSSNVRIGSNASFNSLISNSSAFLSLLRNVLYYLPDWLSALLFGGLFAFVLAAIIKKFC